MLITKTVQGILEQSGAVFSPCERYRYRLWRTRGYGGLCLWVMLNPSTADEHVLDNTIRRCRRFSETWGFLSFEVVNLFGWRSTDPDALRRVEDPVGPDNDAQILAALVQADLVIAAWGVDGVLQQRGLAVQQLAKQARKPLMCLGTTKGGHPLHPLYVPGNTKLVDYR